jgi:hypothetical protein
MSLQMLEARSFKVDKQSIDRNKDAYTNWRMGAEELRLRPYKQRQMITEAENLLDGDKKVDHPDKGSKDTSDACAGAYNNAINSEEKATMMAAPNPRVHINRDIAIMYEKPPIEINLPPGYDRIKTFRV